MQNLYFNKKEQKDYFMVRFVADASLYTRFKEKVAREGFTIKYMFSQFMEWYVTRTDYAEEPPRPVKISHPAPPESIL